MDVAQFASSLLALGKLIEKADELRTGEAGRVRVRIKADVKQGSFDIGIALHWLDTIADAAAAWALTPKGASTLAFLGFLGFTVKDTALLGTKGVIQTIRWLRKRRIATQTIEAGNTTLVTEDGDRLAIDSVVARMVQNPAIRQSIEGFTEPLREAGIDEIQFEERDNILAERITAQEASSFTRELETDPSSSATFQATYQINRLFFERGRKWRLSNGTQAIQAEIIDEQFWKKLEASELAFTKGDFLVCIVRMDQWLSATGLRTEHVVLRIVQHISPSPPQQGKLL